MEGASSFFCFFLGLCLLVKCIESRLPTVDPGVFVLQGVRSCRRGKGYCVLGRSCTVDRDFEPDDQHGNCGELSKSFSSKMSFVCCKYVKDTSEEFAYYTTLSTFTEMDEKFQVLDQNPISIEDLENPEIPEDEDISNLVDIIGVVTDTTGIQGLVTRPYQRPTTPTPPKESSHQENLVSENYRIDDEIGKSQKEHSSQNEFKIINLPKDIQNYLSTKQAEFKANEIDQKSTTTTQNIITTTPIVSTTKDSNDFEEENNATEVFTESLIFTTEESVNTAKPSNLKGSPLVPFKQNKIQNLPVDFQTSTSESEVITTEQALTKPKETSTQSLKSILLQRYEESIPYSNVHRNNVVSSAEEIILPHPVNLNICGLRRSSLKVSENVKTASTYDWCWSAALMNKQRRGDKFECSGTLVELDLVITTAACLKRLRNKDLSTYRIVLGDSNLRDEMPYGVQYHDIKEIVTHPDYLTSGGTHANDIGLIRLEDTATIDHNVCLACISQPNAFIPSHSCLVSGYTLGNIPKDIRRDVELQSPVDGVLRESPVTLGKSSDCRSSLERMAPNPLIVARPDSFLCDVEGNSARSCASTLDGGSPLVCEVGGRWFLAGISSWSQDCTSNPNVYTKVSSFSDWFLNSRLRMYGFITYKV